MSDRLTAAELHSKLIDALGPVVDSHSSVGQKPIDICSKAPYPKLRVYLFNVTKPTGGRSVDECKIQLMMPGQGRGERANFERLDGGLTLLMGYDVEFDVWVLWDANKYADFSFSRNVQVRNSTLIRALSGSLAEQRRSTKFGEETIIASSSENIIKAVMRRLEVNTSAIRAG